MKSILHRMSSKKQSRLRRTPAPPVPPTDPMPQAARQKLALWLVDRLVGWALGETATHLELRARFRPTRAARPPDQAPGLGGEWWTIFQTVYRVFKARLQPYGMDDTWASYSLSFMALRRCARSGKHGEVAYVHAACVNAHKKEFKRQVRQTGRCRPAELEQFGVQPEAVDLRLDLEEVLEGLSALDAAICRMRLLEDRTFREIGAALNMDPSTASRRFERHLGMIREALRDYVVEAPSVVAFAEPPEAFVAAA